MSWDSEAISGAVSNTKDDAVLMESWDEAAGLDDEPVMESWDMDEAEEKPDTKPEPKPKVAPAASAKPEPKPRPMPKAKSRSATPAPGKQTLADKVLMNINNLDPETRKQLIHEAELESDLNTAAELFEGLGVAEETPRDRAARLKQEEEAALKRIVGAALTKETPIEEHPLFAEAETKSDYQNLRKALAKAIVSMHAKSALNYPGALAIDLIRDISKPMSIESIRQTVATLNILIKDKEKEERQARLAKVKGGTATGGAGKKKAKGAKTNVGGSFKKDKEFAVDDMDFDGFGDDDFM